METTEIIIVTTVQELANTIIDFWVDVTNNGYENKVPYAEGSGEIVNLYNMAMFVQNHENTGKKWFTDEEIAAAKTRCVEILEKELLTYDWGFDFTNVGYGMGCFFSKTFGSAMSKREGKSTFGSIEFQTKLFSAELRMRYFPPKEMYSKYLDRTCKDIIEAGKYTEEEKAASLANYPSRPMLAVHEFRSNGPWKTIAYVDL